MRCPDLTDKQAIDHKIIFCNFDVTAGYEFTRDIEFISESTPAPGVGGGEKGVRVQILEKRGSGCKY